MLVNILAFWRCPEDTFEATYTIKNSSGSPTVAIPRLCNCTIFSVCAQSLGSSYCEALEHLNWATVSPSSMSIRSTLEFEDSITSK
jgi:hypothetical protein